MNAYLNDFLFTKERARSPVRALSGGERNRLLLARLFTRPANVLVLDEPTNDLDLETLDLLEEVLADWPGTLLLVSHDRAFLDDVVTSTWAFEGDGRVEEYVGGYEDWLRQRPSATQTLRESAPARPSEPRPARSARLSYNEVREFEALPDKIDALESEHRQLNERVASADFYKEPPDAIRDALARLDTLSAEITSAYERWDELQNRQDRSTRSDA